MTSLFHINCGTLKVPSFPTVVCHCIGIQERDRVVLIDAGIGLHDVHDPVGIYGQALIDAAGFQFNEHDTAVRRLAARGIAPEQVTDVVLTHGDPDHAGGLADFPQALVHIAQEELLEIGSQNPRYLPKQFEHGPRWRTYDSRDNARDWFGLPARRIDLQLNTDVLLVPLFGHTKGHCGIAIRQDTGWLLHVGDAYYVRGELTDINHPVNAIAASRAESDAQRVASVNLLRRLVAAHSREMTMHSYHDITELPAECVDWDEPVVRN
jgi:glyoxylase-like metal-dependent hydrolase (beta-lactamase superfamily II)